MKSAIQQTNMRFNIGRTKLLQEFVVLFPSRCQVLLCKIQRCCGVPSADELNEALLLQVEENVMLLLEDLWVEVIDAVDGLLHMAALYGLSNLHALGDGVEVCGGLGARLCSKGLGSVDVALVVVLGADNTCASCIPR